MVHVNHGLMFGLGSNRESTCPNEFTSIFVQESLILALGAEGNWIRILKKKVNREVPFILPPAMVVSDNQILVAREF